MAIMGQMWIYLLGNNYEKAYAPTHDFLPSNDQDRSDQHR